MKARQRRHLAAIAVRGGVKLGACGAKRPRAPGGVEALDQETSSNGEIAEVSKWKRPAASWQCPEHFLASPAYSERSNARGGEWPHLSVHAEIARPLFGGVSKAVSGGNATSWPNARHVYFAEGELPGGLRRRLAEGVPLAQ